MILALMETPAAVAHWTNQAVASSTFLAAPDWVAPLVERSVMGKETGYLAGSIKQGGTYFIYADVSDEGNPPSGVDRVRADVTIVTPDGSSVPLFGGSYSVGGVTYGFRSGLLTAAGLLAEGARQYAIRPTDAAGNTRTQEGFSVNIDNAAPGAVDVQTGNRVGGVEGRAEAGDTITFTYSERIDPASVLGGWTGSSTNVVVQIIDGGCALVGSATVCARDTLEVYHPTNIATVPLGTVRLPGGDYHGTALGVAAPLTFGATGTPSTMVQSAATITITLGTASATAGTAAQTGNMVWEPSSLVFDAAGNLALSTFVTEPGTSDKEF